MPSLSKMKQSLSRPVSMPKPKGSSSDSKPASAAAEASDAKRAGRPKRASATRRPSVSRPSLKLGRGGSGVVGLDIQPGYVAAVEASVNGVVCVERAVGLALPADTVREGEVLDEKLLAETLRELFRDGKMSRKVRIGLANQRTVVRVMELPPITDKKELMAAVNFQAADQIPMPLASAVLDFHPLGLIDTPSGQRQRVVVAAAQREMVERIVSAVSAAGLRPVGVDLSAFAMIRALRRSESGAESGESASGRSGGAGSVNGVSGEESVGVANGVSGEGSAGGVNGVSGGESAGGVNGVSGGESVGVANGVPGEAQARTLYLNVGGLTNLAIAEGVTCRFTRTVGGGLEAMASQLAERQSIALTDARSLLSRIDLRSPGESSDEAVADAEAVLRGGVREIAGEVRNSLDFHRAQESGGAVGDVVLSGPCLEIGGFATALESELGHAVTRRTVALARGGDLSSVPAERLTVAAGLAVEEVAA